MTVTFAQLGKYGRLGNQLWQIAATIGYAHRHGCDYAFPQWEYVSQFNIPAESFRFVKSINSYKEPHFHYAGIPFKPDTNLHGYFQSERYFEHCKDKVRKALTPKTCFDHRGVTAVHIRRTDYLDPRHKDCYHILTRDNYYNKAMEIVPGPYLIFSDDLGWCKKQFVGDQFSFSEEKDPITDLAHMKGCKNQIIANSSFSWWGAWLNSNPDKVVIAPKKWFGPRLAPSHDTKDLIPAEWVMI